MRTAVIYCRVSDQRQVEGTSLEVQELVCREWCESNGYTIDRVFIEAGRSAKTTDRPVLQEMFAYIESKPKGSISAVLVHRFDRLIRNFDDGLLIQMRLRANGMERLSATERTGNTPEDQFMMRIMDAQAEMDNSRRSQRAKSGMQHRVSSGRWVWRAPTGYLSGGKSGPSLVPDPERAQLICKLFELVAGGMEKHEALRTVTALGLRALTRGKMCQETMRKILTNPVYKGEIYVPTWSKAVRGDFEPLVNERLFDKVQGILSGRAPAYVQHKRDREDFPLRGLILCDSCQMPVTASRSKGKRGHFPYYRCHRAKGHLSVRAEKVEEDFIRLLERLRPSRENEELIVSVFRQVWTEKQGDSGREAATLRQQLGKLEQRRQRVLEQMADGLITNADYAEITRKTAAEMTQIRDRLDLMESGTLDLDTASDYLRHVLWNTAYNWQVADLKGKQKIQRRIFPKGLIYASDGSWNAVTNSFFSMLPAEFSEGEAKLEEMVRPE